MEVAADRASVAGGADAADPLACPDSVRFADDGVLAQMRIEVTAVLAGAVNQEKVAVEDRVIAAAHHPPVACSQQRGAAGSDYVEALVGAAAAAGSAELADRAPGPVSALNRKDVVAVASAPAGKGRRGRNDEEKGDAESDLAGAEPVLQWCSMTRSTMLYSFASSALMK
jgi:hypothetical protein